MATLQPPPFDVTLFDANGKMREVWKKFLLDLQVALSSAVAPADAQYLIATANAGLTNPRNLGLLVSGFLSIVVAAGVATPTSSATIAASVLTGALPALNGAALTTLTASHIVHGLVTKVFADSPYSVGATDEVVLANAVGGVIVVTLPTPTLGRLVTVKKTDASANAVTISAGANTIDGAGTRGLAAQFNAATAVADGANWFVTATV